MAMACRSAPGKLQAFLVLCTCLLGQALLKWQVELGRHHQNLQPCHTLIVCASCAQPEVIFETSDSVLLLMQRVSAGFGQ